MDRFYIVYRLTGTEADARGKAEDICLEQTVEFPGELLPEGHIRDNIVGRIEEFLPDGPDAYRATVSFAIETAARELTQLLNVIFGNISIKPGYRVEEIRLPESLTKTYQGPRFGKSGLREWLGVAERPLLFSALKPMGMSSRELARLAYQFALGGIDIIKDDHGLTDQSFAPFGERVRACAEAVERANRETGLHSIYVANVTAPYGEIIRRARFAKENGARGLLIAPGLVGFDTMRCLAEDDTIGLPVFSHPAMLGSYVLNPQHGISHFALFGQITRLAGADGSIYPNFGGRFLSTGKNAGASFREHQLPWGILKPFFLVPEVA